MLFLAKQCAAVIGGGAALKDLKNAGNKLSTFFELRRFNLQKASSGVNQYSIPDTSVLVLSTPVTWPALLPKSKNLSFFPVLQICIV